MVSTNRSLEDAFRYIRRIKLVCGVRPLRPARLRRPYCDELFNGPFSFGRRSEQDAATGKGKTMVHGYNKRKRKIKEKFRQTA